MHIHVLHMYYIQDLLVAHVLYAQSLVVHIVNAQPIGRIFSTYATTRLII
jgi:hypothetical protein